MMNGILLRGYFGHGNWGDELLLRSLISGLTEYKIPHKRLSYWTGPSLTFQPASIKPADPHNWTGLWAWLTAGSMIFTGGIFYDHLPYFGVRRLRHMDRMVRLTRALGKKVFLFGVSIGPLITPAGRQLTMSILRKANAIWLRDSDSYRFCSRIGIECRKVPDLSALFYTRIIAGTPAAISKDLLFMPCAGGLSASMHAKILNDLLLVAERFGLTIKILPLGTPTDTILARQLGGTCGLPVINPTSPNPLQLFNRIKTARLVVSVRLHGGWGAYICGRPLIQIDYHSKCQGFAQTVQLPDQCLIRPGSSVDALQKAAALWLDPPDGIGPQLIAPILLEKQVRHAFAHLRSLLFTPGVGL
jgi:hypothetical protein